MESAVVKPNHWCVILTPSGLHKTIRATPNTIISLGKYGSFPVNLIIGRPYHFTYEILDKEDSATYCDIRIVPAAELNADALADAPSETPEDGDADANGANGAETETFDIVGEDGQYLMRNNKLTIDDPSRQTLKMEEIELLKKGLKTGSGREIIAKIMASHAALDEKTQFSLAKYQLRKSRKYLKRFSVLPLDVSTLQKWLIYEKDAPRILELREETLGLLHSWSNVHGGFDEVLPPDVGSGRWLVVDEIGGMLVASIAERMGLLYAEEEDEETYGETAPEEPTTADAMQMDDSTPKPQTRPRRRPPLPEAMSATSNTMTLVHSAAQPNLSLLTYFDYDPNTPSPHPLHTHLKTLSWLQLLAPASTLSYTQPPAALPDDEVAQLKPSKRGIYYRKRRRWERTVRVVDETRAGGFDGLVVAAVISTVDVLHHLVPLVRGGGTVAVYSHTMSSLAELADVYSTARKTAYLTSLAQDDAKTPPPGPENEDFPVDPRLLLAPMVQTVRAREWQVLPGRTHPMMTGRGGAEGYLFTGTRVIPSDVQVAARGVFSKKRKAEEAVAKEEP